LENTVKEKVRDGMVRRGPKGKEKKKWKRGGKKRAKSGKSGVWIVKTWGQKFSEHKKGKPGPRRRGRGPFFMRRKRKKKKKREEKSEGGGQRKRKTEWKEEGQRNHGGGREQ